MLQEALPVESVTAEQTSTTLRPIRNETVLPVIGEALARHYARRGATLGLVARRGEELERVARSIAPATVSTYAVDVRDAGAMIAAARDFDAKHGVPDIVIANAGVSRGTLVEHAEDLEALVQRSGTPEQ